MGYNIRYGPKDLYPKEKKRRFSAAIAVLAILAALALRYFWPEGVRMTWDILFPTASQSQEAFRDMIRQIGEGADVGQAVTAFCSDVFQNAVQTNGK